MADLASSILAGDVRATGRGCRLVDDRADGYRPLLRALAQAGRRAWWIGVTGNPGAGKSTLTDGLVGRFRKEGLKVGVIAVDPTSPFSGGAVLGDRIRMQRHFEDPGVFIRSLATRGALGGISRTTVDVARVLEAWGAERILLETVGVGQDELEIARAAHTTLVVVAPGLGDDVQAMKAGLAECADVFAVNKGDKPGADAAVADLTQMIALASDTAIAPAAGHHGPTGQSGEAGDRTGTAALRPEAPVSLAQPATAQEPVTTVSWMPPVVRCIATRGEGVDELTAALGAHRAWLENTESGRARGLERTRLRLTTVLRDAVAEAAVARLAVAVGDAAERIQRGELDMDTALDELVALLAVAP